MSARPPASAARRSWPTTRARCGARAAARIAAAWAVTWALVATAACAHGRPASHPARVAVDRTRPPALAPPATLVLPPVVRRELPNGLRLVIVERHELPLADFILVAGTGTEADPVAKPGLATMTANLLSRGTTTRSAADIAEQQALLGIALDAASTWDRTVITMHTPTAQLDSALALFADVALHPAFAPAEIERARRERLTRLVQLSDRGPFVADRAFAAILFGVADPYGHPPLGTATSVAALTRDDARAFYDAAFRPRSSVLIAVGDLRPDNVERRARALFGAWPTAYEAEPAGTRASPAPPPTPPAVPRAVPTAIHLIDKTDAPQSSVRLGSVGAPRATPDYFPLLVLNTALGGAFTSRLNENLRETHGYTYGAFSTFDMRRNPGPFIAEAEVVGAKTDSSLIEFLHELRAARDTMPVAELNKTKHYLTLELAGEFETTADIARQLVPLVVYGLPDSYYNRYQANVEAVTQSDVQRVAERYIDPDHLTIVVVGDRKSIEAPLRAAGIGPVEIRTTGGAAAPQ
jgi:zinc protease